jgi:hypothetical protein
MEKITFMVIKARQLFSKPIFCTAIPLKFAGGNMSDVRYMPCFHFICDAWVKNWKKGGSPRKELKIIDYIDLRDKTYVQWLETGV